MSYCQDSKKAIVTFKFPGEKEDSVIIENDLPIDVYQVKKASNQLIVLGLAYRAGCVPLPGYEEMYGDPGNASITRVITEQNNACGPNTGFIKVELSNGQIFNGFGTVWDLGISTRIEKAGCKLVVKGNSGAILFEKEKDQCPEYWNVGCENECPDGFMKCETDSFPGYCCVSCDEIKYGIQGMKDLLNELN